MGRIFPPSLAEWHSGVVGFYVGFVYGATHRPEVAVSGIERIIGFEVADGHLSDTREEAAYAGGCFLIGVVVGRRWDHVRRSDPGS